MFNFKQSEELPFMLPAAPKHIEEAKMMSEEERIRDMIKAVSDSKDDPILIEMQLKLIEEDCFKSLGRKIELFHAEVVKLRNERLDDPMLDTPEGTRRAIQEVAIYANKIQGEFKIPKTQNPMAAKEKGSEYYWSI